MVILGIIVTPLPIPLGLLMIAIGLALLAQDSIFISNKIRAIRKRFPKFSAGLKAAEPRLGGIFKQLLQRTDPNSDGQHHSRH